jgi:hypothetical protein
LASLKSRVAGSPKSVEFVHGPFRRARVISDPVNRRGRSRSVALPFIALLRAERGHVRADTMGATSCSAQDCTHHYCFDPRSRVGSDNRAGRAGQCCRRFDPRSRVRSDGTPIRLPAIMKKCGRDAKAHTGPPRARGAKLPSISLSQRRRWRCPASTGSVRRSNREPRSASGR